MAERRGVLGLFREAQAAADAVGRLKEMGFSSQEFEVLTGAPYPEGAFGEAKTEHHLFIFPLMGALSGFAGGLLLTIGTQLSFPMVVGGKPLLSIPPMAIIIYEGTLLGAILFTILGTLFESRLPSPKLRLYDERITRGFIGVLIHSTEAMFPQAERALREAGAVELKYR